MGRPELAQDPRFAANRERNQHETEVDEAVGSWVSGNDLETVEAALLNAKVPASRIFNMADIFADPHYQARDMLVNAENRTGEPFTMTGVVPKLSLSPGHIEFAGGEIGQDTEEVLRDMLGYSEERLVSLRDSGIAR
jgi:crotonobetainyl-CoA:carnitine CoA-transferase CaiB-like acyl-CoA transferase